MKLQHAQECSLLSAILQTVQANEVWVADHNFCVQVFFNYYLAAELDAIVPNVLIALPEEQWRPFRAMLVEDFAVWLLDLAGRVHLTRFKRHTRGQKSRYPSGFMISRSRMSQSLRSLPPIRSPQHV